MKNKIIALMAVIPLIILFTIMTLTSTVSIAVDIPVSGVKINTPTDGGVLTIDMGEYANDSFLQVDVLPYGAVNREYKIEFSDVEGSERGEIEIASDGRIIPKKTGLVKVTVVTHDGGFRDSIIVNVTSSRALGVVMTAYDADEPARVYDFVPSASAGIDYEVKVNGGSVVFGASPYPSSAAAEVRYNVLLGENGIADAFLVNRATGIARARLSGEYVMTVDISPAVEGCETTFVKVIVENDADLTVDGYDEWEGEAGVSEKRVLPDSDSATLYVESRGEIEVTAPQGITAVTVPLETDADASSAADGRRKFAVRLTFGEGAAAAGGSADIVVSAEFGGREVRHTVTLRFEESSTRLFGRYVSDGAFIHKTGETATYSALTEPDRPQGMTYRFETEGAALRIVSQNDGECRVEAVAAGEGRILLYVIAADGTETLADSRRIIAADGYSSPVFSETAATWGIGGTPAVGDTRWDGKAFVGDSYELKLQAAADGGMRGEVADAMVFEVSDPSLAEVTVRDGKAYLSVKGTGRITVTAYWKYAAAYGDTSRAALTLDCVKNGVNVGSYDALTAATESGKPVVLTADIMLGENLLNDDRTLIYSQEETRARLLQYVKPLPTTADWTYYRNTSGKQPDIYYCVEFTADVYGNGHEINADYITQITPDNYPNAAVFRGPLDMVAYSIASVKAQDNVVFLVREDGITLDNVVLKGCSDDSLYDSEGKFELSYLNYTGTTLELMADCSVINSRVSNGRTVVRAFGRDGIKLRGDGSDYAATPVDVDKERIDVRIESCILANAREFILKIGTNRKVYGKYVEGNKNSVAPNLTADGITFFPRDDFNLNDSVFTDNFVLTHVTLSDSALYNSGLFSVGMESSFAGPMLDGGGFLPIASWKNVGGTSYSAVLKLDGEVMLYDWKPLDFIDSSTLIELSGAVDGDTAFLQLNVKEMLRKVCDNGGSAYSDLIYTAPDGSEYAHGGIAFYGGGKNYHMLDVSTFTSERMKEYSVNLSILAENEPNGSNLYLQGTLLPEAAGYEDFRFFMYDAASRFGYEEQQKTFADGTAYDFIRPAQR